MPLDALILKYIYEEQINAADSEFIKKKESVRLNKFPVSFDKTVNKVSTLQPFEVRISIHNLMRVQCMRKLVWLKGLKL